MPRSAPLRIACAPPLSRLTQRLAFAAALGFVSTATAQSWCPPPVYVVPWGPPPCPCECAPVVSRPYGSPTTITSRSVRVSEGNLFLEVTEPFANRIASRSSTNQGPVRDFVLGANVYGEQTTNTVTRLDFLPNDAHAAFTYTLSGTIINHTVGVTPQAAVQSEGQHLMRIVKEIEFDGNVFQTRSPAAFVTPQLRNVGASTRATGVPIVGPIASGMALRGAEERRPQAEWIAAQRVTHQAAPIFNDRIDSQLARINRLLQDRVRPKVAQFNLLPDRQHLTSTDDALQWSVTLRAPHDAPESPTPLVSTARGESLTLAVHESLIHAALDRQSLGGIGLPDVAIDRWFQAFQQLLGGKIPKGATAAFEPQLATILLDPVHPVLVRFDDNRSELILRLGFRPIAGPEIPIQQITIPFTFELTPDAIVMRPGEVQIAPLDPVSSAGPIDDVARELIRAEVQKRLGDLTLPREFPVELPNAPPTRLRVREIELRDGWLTVALD
jgi:hypothetical protein